MFKEPRCWHGSGSACSMHNPSISSQRTLHMPSVEGPPPAWQYSYSSGLDSCRYSLLLATLAHHAGQGKYPEAIQTRKDRNEMNKRARPISEEDIPSIRKLGTFGTTWREYRADSRSGLSDMHPFRRALMNVVARAKLRHVRHFTFDQLALAGYDVRMFDDGALPLDLEKVFRRDVPEHWKIPQPVIVPKIATLRGAVLFHRGLTLLSDRRGCCFSDTRFADGIWRKPTKFNSRELRRYFYANPATDSVLINRKMRCIDVSGRCFSTCSNHEHNFGHFVHDVIS